MADSKEKVRTRFAPSPTGFLHVGNAQGAIFNYLFTRKHQGVFVLRIEDTDRKRYKKEYEEDILESLRWLGIEWDEGPKKKGEYSPYRQSKRGEVYKKYLKKLLEGDKAYYCFCKEEDLEAQREYFKSIGKPPVYNGHCEDLRSEEIREKIKRGEEYVIRFKAPDKNLEYNDLVRGKIEFDTKLTGDFVIAKDFSSPLYNFACVVDDYEMRITHVIRGEDHIPNTPKQILLYQALDLETPKFAHLPLLLDPDRSKLSKRKGTVAVKDFKKEGYLPEALVNFISFLGWNPGTQKEIYSLEELIEDFSLERVRSSGAIFDRNRLNYLNGYYIREKPLEEITKKCLPYLLENNFLEKDKEGFKIIETGEKITEDTLEEIVDLYKERLEKLSEITDLTSFFFKKDLDYSLDLLLWKDQSYKELSQALDKLISLLSKIEKENWGKRELKKILLPESKKFGEKLKKEGNRGFLLWPFRVSLTGKKASAGPFEIAKVLGKRRTLVRIKKAKERLSNHEGK